ncbi:hypothetical protein HMPREF2533_00240, partial [Bacteroides fragilis]
SFLHFYLELTKANGSSEVLVINYNAYIQESFQSALSRIFYFHI